MIRLSAAAGLLYGWVEAFGIHGGSAWRGASLTVLQIIAIYTLLGCVGGILLTIARRLVRGKLQASWPSLYAAPAAVIAALSIPAIGIHTAWGLAAQIACGMLGIAAVWFAVNSTNRPERAPSRLPAVAVVLSVLAGLGLAAWTWRDQVDASPLGPRVVDAHDDTSGADALSSVLPVGRFAPEDQAPKLMIVGIDGASWDVALPLIDNGRMPYLAGLLDRGVGGIILSSSEAFSPIEWTTVATGKNPAHHGLFDLTHTRSTHRRVRTLYSILGDTGFRTLVGNVPGTFPAEPIPGALFAGFPVQKESLNTLGHLFTTRARDAFTLPDQALTMRAETIEIQGQPGNRTGRMQHLEPTAVENSTALSWIKQRLGGGASVYGRWTDRRYGTLSFEETAAGLTFDFQDASGRPLVIAEGQWSPWIRIERSVTPLVFRLRVIEQNADAISIYATPLFPLGADDRIYPSELAKEVDRRFGPYVNEGAGWMLFQAPELLPVLREHQFQLAEEKRNAVSTLWHEQPWDALFYVVTLTDRIQHAFWPFMDHDSYPAIPPPPPYPYEARPGFDPAEFEQVVAESYEFADRTLGDFLQKAGPETIVLVVSDHGGTSGLHPTAPGAGVHDPDGIYVFSGGVFRREEAAALDRVTIQHDDQRLNGEPLRLQDLAPTLLAAMNLPLARDFDGGPSLYILDLLKRTSRSPDLVATYESKEFERAVDDEELDESALEQLRSLGYVK